MKNVSLTGLKSEAFAKVSDWWLSFLYVWRKTSTKRLMKGKEKKKLRRFRFDTDWFENGRGNIIRKWKDNDIYRNQCSETFEAKTISTHVIWMFPVCIPWKENEDFLPTTPHDFIAFVYKSCFIFIDSFQAKIPKSKVWYDEKLIYIQWWNISRIYCQQFVWKVE